MSYTDFVIDTTTYASWKKHKESSIWKNSLFECFHDIPSPRSKGAEGERLIEEFMISTGHKVERAKSSDYDRIISGYKTEIKTSTTWNNTENKFTWQQIRNQDYERIIFLGINPNNIKIYWASKTDLIKYVFSVDYFRQHAGKSGKQELYWLQGIDKLDWFRNIESF